MRRLLITGLCWTLGAALTVQARSEPQPRTLAAPAHEFSAARARRIQQLVAADARPRAVGSAADLAAVQRISDALEGLGLQPTLQKTLVCAVGRCGNVTNVIARIDGEEPSCVLLSAHHDSVEAGPGASDDGAGVAVLLETARALRAGPRLKNSVILLIDDGEEVGSLGATAFATEHPWMRDVAAVINVDSGGTSGLTLLYGTGPGNLGVVDAYSRTVPHPASSSILAIAHAYLPRASDFTVLTGRGLPGLDLAFAGEARYHTALDTVERSHPGSLEHEGESALALTRALASSDLTHRVTQDAAWFDLFGRWLVRWPAAWSLPLALGALGLLALASWRTRLQLTAAARALLASFAGTIASGVLALGAQRVLARLGQIPSEYISEPHWLVLSMLALGLLCVAAVSGGLARYDARALEFGVCWTWALCALATALFLPAASVLFLPVVLVALTARTLLTRTRGATTLSQAAAALAVASVWFPAWALAPETFGISALVLFAAPAAWIGSLLLPGLASLRVQQRRLLALVTSGAVLFGLAGHVLARKFDDDCPQRVNVIAYTDAIARRSVAIVDTNWVDARTTAPVAMAAALARIARQTPRYAPPFAWSSLPVLFAPLSELAPSASAITASAAALEPGATALRVQLAPTVRRLTVYAPESAAIAQLWIGSRRWPSIVRPGRAGTRYRAWRLYAPAQGAALRLEWNSAHHAAAELTFVADMPELPDAVRALIDSRPPWATTSQTGDQSVVSTRLQLAAE